MTTETIAILLCPFCGGDSVTVAEASTFRLVAATCDQCGAVAPEARRDTTKAWPDAVEDTIKAIAAWNARAPISLDAYTAHAAAAQALQMASQFERLQEVMEARDAAERQPLTNPQ